ncbi:hypothetical protein TNCV_1107901 [Trichonephila clavipes]|nr:hypothetical protein TNCV_1107901 [Trichonephila clavipes]
MPRRRNRRQYEQLLDFERERIIGLIDADWSNRRIGRHLDRSNMSGHDLTNNVAGMDSAPFITFQTAGDTKGTIWRLADDLEKERLPPVPT